jgi:adenine-specific DNA-methyltransferase
MIESLVSNFSNQSLVKFFRLQNSSFVEYSENLSDLVSEFDKFDNLIKLGEIEYENTDVLLVFSCEYLGELTSRSSKKAQYEIAKKALKEDFKDGAVFVFYDETGKFRFSFIRKNYGDKEQKYSNWKRFTYFVDPVSQTNRTFKVRIGACNFDSLENIQDTFSIEPISKDFFDGYKAQYEKFCEFMRTDKTMQYNFRQFLVDGTNKAVRDYVKKMLGRIVFLHFLQKKGWMGVPKDSANWTGGDQNFLENLFKNSDNDQQAKVLPFLRTINAAS